LVFFHDVLVFITIISIFLYFVFPTPHRIGWKYEILLTDLCLYDLQEYVFRSFLRIGWTHSTDIWNIPLSWMVTDHVWV
jgi:hypothetical protein